MHGIVHPAALLALVLPVGCSRAVDNAPPVATPTVTIARSDVAIGSPVDFSYRFVVAADAPAFAENYWVFVHFLDTDGELMWTDDHEPPTPTTAWKAGSTIEYSRTMFVPKFPYVGETRIEVGLFSRASGERLPLAGEPAGLRAYRVGTFNLSLQTDNTFVVFRDGWHETETGESGLEWQWSRDTATLSFRNPKRDATLFLEVDRPVELPEPQSVEVRIGERVLDRFAPSTGRRELRRIAVTAEQLGDADTVDVVVTASPTFVPSTLPALNSTDARELGVRVFRAFVQPS
jgi:hypothetical protein